MKKIKSHRKIEKGTHSVSAKKCDSNINIRAREVYVRMKPRNICNHANTNTIMHQIFIV